MENLIKRTISGLLLIILAFIILSKNRSLISFFIWALSTVGIRELYIAFNNKGIEPVKALGYGSCILFLFYSLNYKWASLINIFLIILFFSILVYIIKKDIKFLDILITVLGIIYIPFFMQHIIFLEGSKYLGLIFIIAWGTDTFAYIVGSLFGKRKLCPEISPKKTIEGSIGGIFGTIFLLLIYIRYYEISHIWRFLFLGISGSLVAQMGDLLASKIKRYTGVKDYGFILPGHGGILDRFDSIILVAPFIYYYIILFFK